METHAPQSMLACKARRGVVSAAAGQAAVMTEPPAPQHQGRWSIRRAGCEEHGWKRAGNQHHEAQNHHGAFRCAGQGGERAPCESFISVTLMAGYLAVCLTGFRAPCRIGIMRTPGTILAASQ